MNSVNPNANSTVNWPELPDSLAEHDLTQAELADLWYKLCKELLDKEYSNRTHDNRRTYDAGCHGPLCSKAVREFGRRRRNASPHERFKFLDPILDYWKPIAVAKITAAQEQILLDLAG